MQKGPLAQWGVTYRDNGFSPLPIIQREGIPGLCGRRMMGWQNYSLIAPSPSQIEIWTASDPMAGLGLACGFGGLIAVDVDHVDAYPAIKEVFGGIRPPSKVGSKGACAFFWDNGARIQTKIFQAKKKPDGKAGEVLVEILGSGRSVTIPPSINRKTHNPYRWVYASLEDLRPEQLPIITQAHVDALGEVLSPLMATKYEPVVKPLGETSGSGDIDLSHAPTRIRYERCAEIALRREVDKNKALSDGRQRQLFMSICALGKWVWADQLLSKSDVFNDLTNAAKDNGLLKKKGARDIMRTLERGLEWARNHTQLTELAERPRR